MHCGPMFKTGMDCKVIALSLGLCFPVSAATFYVSTTGTGNGTAIGTPMSWNNAQTNLGIVGGDTVYFRGGTYRGVWSMTRNVSGGTPIYFRNYTGEQVIFDCYLPTVTITSGINNSTTTLPVSSTAAFRVSDDIQIDFEQMDILSVDSSTQLTVQRGWDGTTAASHSSGASVQFGKGGHYFAGSNYWVLGDGMTGMIFRNSNPVRTNAPSSTFNRPGMVTFDVSSGVISGVLIHDTENGIGSFSSASNVVMYGNITINCGNIKVNQGTGYSYYLANSVGTKDVIGALAANPYGYNVHVYTESGALRAIRIKHSTFIGPSAWTDADLGWGYQMDNIICAGTDPLNFELVANNLWKRPSSGVTPFQFRAADITLTGTTVISSNIFDQTGELSLVMKAAGTFYLSNNIIVTPRAFSQLFNDTITTFAVNHNAYYGGGAGGDTKWYIGSTPYTAFANWQAVSIASSSPDANGSYSASRPTGSNVVIYPLTQYGLTNLANVAIFDWSSNDLVSVNLSSTIPLGAAYTVIHSQDPLTTLQGGFFNGASITLPMTNLPIFEAYGSTNPIVPSYPEMAAFRISWTPRSGSGSVIYGSLTVGGSVNITR